MEDYLRIETAIKYLNQNFQQQPDLDQVARVVGLSPFYFQRLFKEWAGITPKRFVQFLTSEYIKNKLRNSSTLLNTTYDAGLSSTSRLQELLITVEAVSPKEFKQLGSSLEINYGFHSTPFGECLVAITSRGICGIHFVINTRDDALNNLKQDYPLAKFIQSEQQTKAYAEQVFSSHQGKLNVLLVGTNFQIQVWKALLQIPFGEVVSYANIAERIGKPKALRAVGTAIGRNHVGYLIPCHRVINSLGIVGNYRWGIERKQIMLGYEAANAEI